MSKNIETRLRHPSGIGEPYDHEAMREAADELAALKAKLARAKEALRPFAQMGQNPSVCGPKPRDEVVWCGQAPDKVTFSDLRLAAAVLAELESP